MKRRFLKTALLAFGLGGLWCLWLFLYENYGFELLFCAFQNITGLYCPGCGTMRAIVSLCSLDLEQALRFNALSVAFMPFLAVAVARSVFLYIKNGEGIKPGKYDRAILIVAVSAAVLYGIARNLPWFSALAPTVIR